MARVKRHRGTLPPEDVVGADPRKNLVIIKTKDGKLEEISIRAKGHYYVVGVKKSKSKKKRKRSHKRKHHKKHHRKK